MTPWFTGKTVLITGGGSGIGRAAAVAFAAEGAIVAVAGRRREPAGRAQRLKDALPAGRVGNVSEAAAAVLWLASPEAGFTVGHDLVIDGGATA